MSFGSEKSRGGLKDITLHSKGREVFLQVPGGTATSSGQHVLSGRVPFAP